MNKKNANSKNAFVTIVGRANAGKSSLLNALVGEKIAAVSDKPQTTRTKITGVLTKGETQFVFMDTPGMHKAKNKLSEHMLNAVNESVAGVDLIILMADCTKKISENERELVKGFKTGKTKVILVLNKIDLLENKEDLIAVIAEYSKLFDFIDIVPVSVLEKDGLDTKVSQGGRNFSGGQRQRLTVARALVKNPDILILDDSSSALDLLTEARLKTAIAENDKNMTRVIVSQRISTIRDADIILVLDDGKPVGIGKHSELAHNCEVYREICMTQIPEEFEDENTEGVSGNER